MKARKPWLVIWAHEFQGREVVYESGPYPTLDKAMYYATQELASAQMHGVATVVEVVK